MIEKNCNGCTVCCESLTFGYAKPIRDTALELYHAWGCQVYYDANKNMHYLKVPLKCRHLTDDGCSIYDKRPAECRMLDCDKHPILKHESRTPK